MTGGGPDPDRTWRSWFWNLVLAGLLAAFLACYAGIVATEKAVAARIVYAVIGLLIVAALVRALLLRVVATPAGIRVHSLWGVKRIPWESVERITADDRAARGFRYPVVHLRDGGTVPLSVLGSYRSGGLAQRAAAELTERLRTGRR